jgi:hypothetical protein
MYLGIHKAFSKVGALVHLLYKFTIQRRFDNVLYTSCSSVSMLPMFRV